MVTKRERYITIEVGIGYLFFLYFICYVINTKWKNATEVFSKIQDVATDLFEIMLKWYKMHESIGQCWFGIRVNFTVIVRNASSNFCRLFDCH